MKPWTVQDASRELDIDQGYLRRVLNEKENAIPGVEKVGRQWLGPPSAWKRWQEQRPKRRRAE